ncbi:MAG: hypothetical protein ACTHJW_08595 [Streptosporangiaceae bacterium]
MADDAWIARTAARLDEMDTADVLEALSSAVTAGIADVILQPAWGIPPAKMAEFGQACRAAVVHRIRAAARSA